jgi:LysM repeat protein
MIKNILTILFVSFVNISFAQKITTQQYINQYKEIAVNEMKRTGIPASITLAQGILESNSGNSTLAIKANNHFGIKCHNWTGSIFTHDDDRLNECFRKYKSAEQSFRDHSEFLTTHQRYAFLFNYKTTDYKNWAHGLKKAGYATNPRYAKMLIKIIEENKLYKYDSKKYKPEKEDITEPDYDNTPVLADNVDNYAINPFGNDIKTYNRINYIIVKEGDTFISIAEKYGLRPWQLYKYNELPKTAEPISGKRLYIQPKRRKAPVGNNYHTIKPGENMYTISQKYGIKLKHLYRLNNMQFGTEPDIGYTLSLRKRLKK